MARRQRKRVEIWLGLLVLVSAVLLLWGYFWLTGQPLGQSGYTATVILPNAEGLERGDPVQLSGVEVGVVRSIELLGPDQVAVRIWLEQDVELPRDTRAVLESAGVFGDRIIRLRAGTSDRALSEGDTLETAIATGLLELASDLGGRADSVLARVERLLADTTIAQVHGTVSALPGTVRELEGLIRENSAGFAALSRSLRETAETLKGKLDDAQVDQAIQDLETTAATLNQTSESLREVAESLSSIAKKVDSGQGTLGRLVNDPGLYEDLRSASQSLTSLTEDIRLNPGRYLKLAIF